MKIKPQFISWPFFVLMLFIFSSCSNDFDGDGIPDALDKCPKEGLLGHVDSLGCNFVAPKMELGNVRLFQDNSSSNKGYLKGNTGFKDVVSDLISELSNFAEDRFKINFISGQIDPYTKSSKEYIKDFNNNEIPSGTDCSELHGMLDLILTGSDSNDISILISDNILSFCENPKRRNKNSAEMRSYLKDVLGNYSKQNFALSLHAFTSEFEGTYFVSSLGDKGIYCKGTRPYYVWVFGHEKIIGSFESYLSKLPRFYKEKKKSLFFGQSQLIKNNVEFFYLTGRQGNWRLNAKQQTLSNISFSGDHPIKFTIGVNMKGLPPHVQEVDFIKANFQTGYEYLSLSKVENRKDFKLNGNKPKEQVSRDNCTHFLTFELTELVSDQELTMRLNNNMEEAWYKDWATDDDSKPEDGKTYFLNHLVDAMIDTYKVSEKPLIEISLNLEK